MASNPGSSKDFLIPKDKATNIWGGVFTVLVGQAKKPIMVHETVLGKSSTFFRNAMKPNWAQRRIQAETIDLTHRDPEEFSIYVHWLYFQTIPLLSSEDDHEKDFMTLAKAYTLGEELLDGSFQNAILDAFVMILDRSANCPSPAVVSVIYDGTLPTSPARRLMIDFYSYVAWDDKEWAQVFDECSKEILADVVKAMVKARDNPPRITRPWTKSSASAYHEPNIS